jgi:hypothetical protein
MFLFLILELVRHVINSAKKMDKLGYFSDLEKYPGAEVTYT